jgi:LPS export ABC transporter protein LptC
MPFKKLKYFGIRKMTFFSFIVMLTMILGSCENEIAKIKTVTNTEDLPAITAEGFEMLVSDSSVIRSKLQAPLLIKHDNEKDPYIEFPKGMKIVEYDAKMNVISSITAQYAKNFTGENRWEAKNNVIAVNQKGDTLKTEYLVWDTKNQKIYSDQFVKIIQKDQIYTGIGFESNQDFSSYHIKNLKGNMYVNVDK